MHSAPHRAGHTHRGSLAARRRDDWAAGEDPLLDSGGAGLAFNTRAVTLVSNLTWNAAPSSRPIDLKATLTARVAELGLGAAACQYLRSVAGARYSARTDLLRISSERHGDAAANKRYCVERLALLVAEARELAAKFGPMPLQRRLPAMPAA